MDDNDRFGPESDSQPRRGYDGMLREFARKAVETSFNTLLSTDEGLRAFVGALVPKEIGQYVSRELEAFRTGFLEVITKEMGRFLDNLDLAGEVKKVLDGLDVEVKLNLSLSHKNAAKDGPDGSLKVDVVDPVVKVTKASKSKTSKAGSSKTRSKKASIS
ncbi:MAG TPA: hypothetical protein PLC97_10115 [Myxococcota bacterium]|nr:hypothetical protein [Myxococcota bacterium]